MRIAHIQIYAEGERFGNKFSYDIEYLHIEREEENSYYIQNEDKGIEPRGNLLYKKLNYVAADDGYTSLNMPEYIRCRPHEASGVIYVLESDIEKGKSLLKQALLGEINDDIARYEMLKTLIQNG